MSDPPAGSAERLFAAHAARRRSATAAVGRLASHTLALRRRPPCWRIFGLR